MNLSPLFFILILPLFEFSSGEECINYKKHSGELARCCDVTQPFPIETKDNACRKYATKSANRDPYVYAACYFQCCYEGMGIVRETTIDQAKISEYLKPLDEDTQQFLFDVHVECSETVLEKEKGPCNQFTLNMIRCVLDRLQTECPENHYHSSPMCDKQKDGVEICE